VRSEQAAAGDGLLCQRLFVAAIAAGRRAGDHAHRGIVDGGQRNCAVDVNLGGGQRHGKHRAGGQIVDQPSARGDDGERIFEREDAGDASGYVFADAVAGHRRRLDAKRHPPLGERVFDGEERGLREPGLVQLSAQDFLFGVRRIKRRDEIDAQRLAQKRPAQRSRVSRKTGSFS
jgi:hypothetical protein